MLHRVALVRTDVSEKCSASITRVTRICELGTTLAVTSNRCTLVHRLLVTAKVVSSALILVTLTMEALRLLVTAVLPSSSRTFQLVVRSLNQYATECPTFYHYYLNIIRPLISRSS
jgi:hypothetical protein